MSNTLRFDDAGPQLSTEDIASVESRAGVSFPAEYREFLLRSNGGKPVPSWFSMNSEYEDDISYFLSVNPADWHSDLATQIVNYRDWILPHYLPFAICGGGDVLCLALGEDERGVVFHWNHGLANEAGNPTEDNMTRLSGSLSEFLEGLATLEELEEQAALTNPVDVPEPQRKPWWRLW